VFLSSLSRAKVYRQYHSPQPTDSSICYHLLNLNDYLNSLYGYYTRKFANSSPLILTAVCASLLGSYLESTWYLLRVYFWLYYWMIEEYNLKFTVDKSRLYEVFFLTQ